VIVPISSICPSAIPSLSTLIEHEPFEEGGGERVEPVQRKDFIDFLVDTFRGTMIELGQRQ
jgi:hypothetical protein